MTSLGQSDLSISTTFGIPIPEDREYRLSRKIDTEKTVAYMAEIAVEYAYQTEILAALLEQPEDLDITCRNIWRWYRKYIPYEYDRNGNEELRTPSRLFWDAVRSGEGVDCDCYAITSSTILLNLGIPHLFRVVEWRAGEGFQHVYVVAIDPNTKQEYPIDPIPEVRGELSELSYNQKQDFIMNETHLLAGGAGVGTASADSPLTATEFEGIIREVLGTRLDMTKTVRRREFVERIILAILESYQQELLKMMQSSEATEAGSDYAKVQLDMISRALEDFANPARRDQTLKDAINIYEESQEFWQTLYELHTLASRLDNEFTTISSLIEEVGAGGLAGGLGFKFFKKIGRALKKGIKAVSKVVIGGGGGQNQPVIYQQQAAQATNTSSSQAALVAAKLQNQNAQLQQALQKKEEEEEEREEQDQKTKKYWLWGAIAGGVIITILLIYIYRMRSYARSLQGKLKRKRKRRRLSGGKSMGMRRKRRKSTTTTRRRRRVSAPRRRMSGTSTARRIGRGRKKKKTRRRRRKR